MSNERYSENLVLEEMGVHLGKNDFGYVFPQGETGNYGEIEKCLRKMGGKPSVCKLDDMLTVGLGKAKPEYIITFNDDKNTILLVECKRNLKDHKSRNLDMPQKYSVDGVLFYAKHFKDIYNVIAIAVSGTSKENLKVNTFYWKKCENNPLELEKANDTILEPLNYLNLVTGKKLAREFSLQKIRELAQIMHEKLRQIKISEKDKPIFIAGILIALQNDDFRRDWNSINSFNSLLTLMISSIGDTLDKSDIKKGKIEAIKSSFSRIKSNEKIKTIPLGETGSLAWFIKQLEIRILPMMNHYEYSEDALSVFYHEFIKYSATDGKGLGIVLTPKHLTHFMCKLGEINKQSKVIDICCGSGSFLVTAMGLMCKEANATEIENIKQQGLYGIELDTDLYTLAITNMIIRKDGKSNILCGDCFSQDIFSNLKHKHLSLGLINPPYAQKDKCELEFVERLLNVLEPRGLAVAVVPVSCAIGTKFKDVRERLFKHHTLKAVFSMPDDIFYPTGVNVCVMVWEAHKTHDSSKPTFFGYCKNDGFVKRKKMGRVDYYNKWDKIEEEWLNLYETKKIVDGKSALQCVKHSDEWLCEAYMKIDYTDIAESEFNETVRKYLAFEVANGYVTCEKNFDYTNAPKEDVTLQEFSVNELFTPYLAKAYHKNALIEISRYDKVNKVEYITRTGLNNGMDCYVEKDDDYKIEQGNCLSVGAEGVTFFYHENEIICGNKVTILRNEHLNKYNAMYLLAVLNHELKNVFNYGRAIVLGKVKQMKIKLPAKNGQPDWQYMETYIKSLPYADRI
ncbi:MAG: N-6 DNA methylase [Bacteroides sp.]|nr:N-6 DNA methylase [Bacillota bacterium]MCM1393403.1 N-6 DNA methylase [[Eubacterium] siraeum]MCM1455389.1 N-6 DNA methylase [Bacteroides sp.]